MAETSANISTYAKSPTTNTKLSLMAPVWLKISQDKKLQQNHQLWTTIYTNHIILSSVWYDLIKKLQKTTLPKQLSTVEEKKLFRLSVLQILIEQIMNKIVVNTMIHVKFRQLSDLLAEYLTYIEAYTHLIQSTGVPHSLEHCKPESSEEAQKVYITLFLHTRVLTIHNPYTWLSLAQLDRTSPIF